MIRIRETAREIFPKTKNAQEQARNIQMGLSCAAVYIMAPIHVTIYGRVTTGIAFGLGGGASYAVGSLATRAVRGFQNRRKPELERELRE